MWGFYDIHNHFDARNREMGMFIGGDYEGHPSHIGRKMWL